MSKSNTSSRGEIESLPDAAPIATNPLTGRPLLTVELVPRTCWFSNVRSEVSAEDWDHLKGMVSERAGRRCEVCGGRGPRWPVETHEVWEYDDAAHVQRLLGMVALCPSCHEVKHIGLAHVRGRHEPAIRHLARTNGWTVEDANAYIEVQFEVWSRRSRHEWQLDLSWLDALGIVGVRSDR